MVANEDGHSTQLDRIIIGPTGIIIGSIHMLISVPLDTFRLPYDLSVKKESKNSPNQPPQTPTSGTPAGGAPVAPPPGAADRKT